MATYKQFLRGDSGTKDLEGGLLLIAPFVGVDESGLLGVGYTRVPASDDAIDFFGERAKRHLIHAWRAMKFLELSPTLSVATLPNCWLAADPAFISQKEALGRVGSSLRIFGFADKHREILNSIPSPEEAKALIEGAISNQIVVSPNELIKELDNEWGVHLGEELRKKQNPKEN